VECASWRSASSSRRAVSDARSVRNSLSDLRCAVQTFITSSEAVEFWKRTFASSHSILSLSFSSLSSCSLSASQRRSFSSLSITTSLSLNFFSRSFLVVVSAASWRSRDACASCEVKACDRCCRFAVECWGSDRDIQYPVIKRDFLQFAWKEFQRRRFRLTPLKLSHQRVSLDCCRSQRCRIPSTTGRSRWSAVHTDGVPCKAGQ
jgi:hypothetical protein